MSSRRFCRQACTRVDVVENGVECIIDALTMNVYDSISSLSLVILFILLIYILYQRRSGRERHFFHRCTVPL